MAQQSLHYAVARVKSKEGALITPDRFERMIDAASFDDAMRMLQEAGYGASAQGEEYERMTNAELEEAVAFIQGISPAPELTGLFIVKGDFHNMKAAFKMRVLGVNEPAAYTNISAIPYREVADAVAQQKYDALPSMLQDAAGQAEDLIAEGFDPRKLDMLLDAAWLAHCVAQAKAGRDPFILEYFTRYVDAFNASLILRGKTIGENAEWTRQNLVSGGKIEPDTWLDIALNGDAHAKLMKVAGKEFADAFDQALQSGAYWEFEKYRDSSTMAQLKKAFSDLFTIEPLVAYLMAKEAEAQTVRMILAAKQNAVPQEVLRERLRGYYG